MTYNDPPTPFCSNFTVNHGDNYGSHLISFANIATYFQVTNYSSTTSLNIKLNGLASAILELDPQTTQIFSQSDMVITSCDFQNIMSGSALRPSKSSLE